MKYATVKDKLPMTIIYLIKYAQYIPVKTMNVEATLLCSINSTNVIDLAEKFLFKKMMCAIISLYKNKLALFNYVIHKNSHINIFYVENNFGVSISECSFV